MAEGDPQQEDGDEPGVTTLSPNQVVAYNLARARALRGWTQDQARQALAPYLGALWSKANYSGAERSVAGERIRNFDADEIVAFARAFELPVAWFFLPPPPSDQGHVVRLKAPDEPEAGRSLALLIDLVFGDDQAVGLLVERLREFTARVRSPQLTEAQRRIETLAQARLGAVAAHALSDVGQWGKDLRMIAYHLEELFTAAMAGARRELGIGEPQEG